MRDLTPCRLMTRETPPITAPVREEMRMMNGKAFHPIHAPIMARSLTSPPPIPSRPVSFSNTVPTRKRNPPPPTTPIRASRGEIAADGKKENASPIRIPGREITSGIILCCRSMKAIAMSAAVKKKQKNSLGPQAELNEESDTQEPDEDLHQRIPERNRGATVSAPAQEHDVADDRDVIVESGFWLHTAGSWKEGGQSIS